jgi:hypothetical protein
MLSFDTHNTEGMEFTPCEIIDDSRTVTRKKKKKKTVYFREVPGLGGTLPVISPKYI